MKFNDEQFKYLHAIIHESINRLNAPDMYIRNPGGENERDFCLDMINLVQKELLGIIENAIKD